MSLVALCSAAMGSACGVSPEGGTDTIRLPEDGSVAVVVLDSRGGFRALREREAPYLVIRADGSLTLSPPQDEFAVVEAKMPAEELRDLLHFILEEQGFGELTAQGIDAAVRQAHGLVNTWITDASTTVVTVRTAETEHSVSFYALGVAAQKNPQIQPLQRLYQVVSRLGELCSLVLAGGAEGLSHALELVNKKFGRTCPRLAPFAADDLAGAVRLSDGRTRIWFQGGETLPSGTFIAKKASVETTADGMAEVRAHASRKVDMDWLPQCGR